MRRELPLLHASSSFMILRHYAKSVHHVPSDLINAFLLRPAGDFYLATKTTQSSIHTCQKTHQASTPIIHSPQHLIGIPPVPSVHHLFQATLLLRAKKLTFPLTNYHNNHPTCLPQLQERVKSPALPQSLDESHNLPPSLTNLRHRRRNPPPLMCLRK